MGLEKETNVIILLLQKPKIAGELKTSERRTTNMSEKQASKKFYDFLTTSTVILAGYVLRNVVATEMA